MSKTETLTIYLLGVFVGVCLTLLSIQIAAHYSIPHSIEQMIVIGIVIVVFAVLTLLAYREGQRKEGEESARL